MIAGQICKWAHARPDKRALSYNGQALPYAVFMRGIDAARRFLEESSLPNRGIAAVLVPGLLNSWTAVLAIRSLGLDTVCVASLSAALDLGLKDISCIVTTRALLAQSQSEANAFPEAKRIAVPISIYSGIHQGALPDVSDYAGRTGGHILYSSGTTGKYKMVLLDSGHEGAFLDRIARHRGMTEETAWYAAHFPLWTGAGFNAPLATWFKGGHVLIDTRSDWAGKFFDLDVTQTTLTPHLIDALLAARRQRPGSIGDFRLNISGGSLSSARRQDITETLTKRLTNIYTSTEASTIAASYEGDIANFEWVRPLDDRTVEIVRDTGEECADGEEGEVRVALLDCDAHGYLDDEDATARHFRDGYFYPGDMALRQADGRIRILGRSGDVINLQGYKLAVGPLEEKVQSLLRARAVCLFSRLNDAGQDELIVAIEADGRPPESGLAQVKRMFSRFDTVRLEVLDRFPRTESGLNKIKRGELRRLIVGSR